jgi:hypothetical protein
MFFGYKNIYLEPAIVRVYMLEFFVVPPIVPRPTTLPDHIRRLHVSLHFVSFLLITVSNITIRRISILHWIIVLLQVIRHRPAAVIVIVKYFKERSIAGNPVVVLLAMLRHRFPLWQQGLSY